MYHGWIDATKIRKDTDRDIWVVDYSAHPLLDPNFPQNSRRLLHLSRLAYKRIATDDEAYRQELSRLFRPLDSRLSEHEDLALLSAYAAEYLVEADIYLESTIDLLPPSTHRAVSPLYSITSCNDVRQLLGLSFYGENQRQRYEARRKLCLAQLLVQIDQSRNIQNGPRHKKLFEQFLDEGLWQYTTQQDDLIIGYQLNKDGNNIDYTSRPGQNDKHWQFRSSFIEKDLGGRKISLDVLYYNCRFKRSVAPISFEIVDGHHKVLERARWGDMRSHTSGSILSKMIRKGINSPSEVGDVIGAMFIVNDNDALNDLLMLLDSCIGTPLGWRNVTDTMAEDSPGSTLNAFSSKQFKVFKGDVDILTQGTGDNRTPYRFPVEIQIFTLEGYLRTVCGAHEASHHALKMRQFLYGLVPMLFPRDVFGSQWLESSSKD